MPKQFIFKVIITDTDSGISSYSYSQPFDSLTEDAFIDSANSEIELIRNNVGTWTDMFSEDGRMLKMKDALNITIESSGFYTSDSLI